LLIDYFDFIENGIVILGVEGEFEVRLGIINDNLSSLWHVYQTKLFLRDPEEPGKILNKIFVFTWFVFFFIEQDLMHPMQVN